MSLNILKANLGRDINGNLTLTVTFNDKRYRSQVCGSMSLEAYIKQQAIKALEKHGKCVSEYRLNEISYGKYIAVEQGLPLIEEQDTKRQQVTRQLIALTEYPRGDDYIIMGKAATVAVNGRYYNVKISDGGVA